MQGYPQQQPYGDYSTTSYPQQQPQQQQQQQYAYGTNTVSGDYGSYYAPTATGDLNSGMTSNAYGGGAYNSQYVQQQQPQQQQQQQQQQVNSGYNNNNNNNNNVNSSSQWQQSYNYQDQNYATNTVGNGGMDNMGMTGSSTAQSPAFGTGGNTSTMQDVGGDQSMAAPNATDENGLRWTWSTYPNTYRDSKSESLSAVSIPMPEMIIPLACMYTPLQPIDASHLVIGDPAARGQQCPNCGAFWNKHCYREEGKFWVCLSCLRRNPTPPSYNPEHPALHYDTVEYIPPITSPANQPLLGTGTAEEAAVGRGMAPTRPTFIFIIDTCIPSDELEALKSNIVRCLDWLPSQSLIGLISFGARVSVWELGTSALPRCYNIRGDKAYDQAELASMLQLTDALPVRGRFLSTLEECEFTLTTLVEELQCDDTVTPSNKRPLRTTGTAVSVGVRLLEALHHGPTSTTTTTTNNKDSSSSSSHFAKGGRLLLFTGGPCTRGPGTVVSTDKEKMMRFHRDIIDGDIPFYESAFKMYNELEKRLSDVHACLDVFTESFDQVGILEMRQAVNQTGGTFICGDAFNHHMFSTSLQRYFDRCDLRIRALETEGGDGSNFVVRSAFGVAFEVHTSADTLVSGVLGPCVVDEKANNAKPHRASSPIQVGVGGTTRWRVSTIDQGVTYTFVFDTATLSSKKGGGGDNTSASSTNASPTGNSLSSYNNMNNNNNMNMNSNNNNMNYSNGTSTGTGGGESKRRFVQFVTRFRTPHGESRVRVTSVVLPISPTPPPMNNNNNNNNMNNNRNTTANSAWSAGCGVFDQTCAATVLARIAVFLLERHPSRWDAATRWLDTLLVRFVRRHAVFTPGVPESLRLHPSLALFPSFVFNLRRSEYFMMLNISPDETVFKRHWLMREQVENCVRMIQPTLHSYDIETPIATPVPLDSCSLRTDNILLMDAFFNIHIMWGTTIYAWIQAKYQDDPEYAYFAQLLNAVEDDANALLAVRYPYPRFSRTDANGSEARHIKTRMNPTTTHHSGGIGAAGGLGNANSNMMASAAGDHSDVIYTDEASIVKFMESLKKAVVSVDAKVDGLNNNSNGSW